MFLSPITLLMCILDEVLISSYEFFTTAAAAAAASATCKWSGLGTFSCVDKLKSIESQHFNFKIKSFGSESELWSLDLGFVCVHVSVDYNNLNIYM